MTETETRPAKIRAKMARYFRMMYRSRMLGKRTGMRGNRGPPRRGRRAGPASAPRFRRKPASPEKRAVSLQRLQEQIEAGREEEDVRAPHPQEGRDPAVHGQLLPGGDQDVIEQDDGDADGEAARPPALLRRHAQGQAQEDEDETDEGKGELLVDLDPVGAEVPGLVPEGPVRGRGLRLLRAGLRDRFSLGLTEGEVRPKLPHALPELQDILLPDPLPAGHRREEALDVDPLLEPLERRDAVFLRLGQRIGMDRAVREDEGRLLGLGEEVEPSLPGQDQPRLGGVLGQVDEDVPPRLVPVDLLDVEDHLGNGLVELPGDDPNLDLGQDRAGDGLDPFIVGPRSEEKGQVGRHEPAGEGEDEEGPGQPPGADPERPERRDLGVGRKPAEAGQEAHQDGHRDGERQERRNEVDEDLGRQPEGDALGDEELGQDEDLVHQEDERAEEKADAEGRGDFPQDIAVEELEHAAQFIP